MVFKMERGLPPNKIVPAFRTAVDGMRTLLPVVNALRSPALKDRHWNKVYDTISTTFTRDADFTVQVGGWVGGRAGWWVGEWLDGLRV